MFHELLDNPTSCEPGCLQADAQRLFPGVVQKSHLESHKPGACVPSSGKYVVIGVASYAPEELRLLDDLEATFQQWRGMSSIAVFDLMECTNTNDLRMFVPQFAMVSQTPVVVLWDNGKEVTAQSGLRMVREVLQTAGVLK